MQGMEQMFRAMGLGEVLDAAKQLAASGAVQKIIKFADDAETIRNDLDAIKRHLGIAADVGRSTQLIEGTATVVRSAADEPGSGGAAHRGVA